MQTGKITGREIKKNRDGKTDTLILQVEISSPDDVQSIELVTQAGENTNPPDEAKAYIEKISDTFKICIGTDDGIPPTLAIGEKELYSSQSGVKKAQLQLKNTGTWIASNDNGDITLADTGEITIKNSSGEVSISTAGLVSVNNSAGAKVELDIAGLIKVANTSQSLGTIINLILAALIADPNLAASTITALTTQQANSLLLLAP